MIKADGCQQEYSNNGTYMEDLKLQLANKEAEISKLVKEATDKNASIVTLSNENQALIQQLKDERSILNQLNNSFSMQKQKIQELEDKDESHCQGDSVLSFMFLLVLL